MKPNRNINSGLAQNLNDFGFIKTAFFSNEEVHLLNKEIHSILPINAVADNSYHVTLLSSDKNYKNSIYQLLKPIIEHKIKKKLEGYDVLITNLIIKPPYSGEVPLHQNWTFTDEINYRTYTLWIPLIDADRINGTLEFIAGSHNLFFNEKRGHNTPYFFINEVERLKKYLIPIPLIAGDAILFDDAILHYSRPNLSAQSRIAIQVTLVPTDAPLYHYHFQKGLFYDRIYTFKSNKKFYDTLPTQPTKITPFEKYRKRIINHKEWQQIAYFYTLYNEH